MGLTKFGQEVVRVEVGGHQVTLTAEGAARLGLAPLPDRSAVTLSGRPAPPKPRTPLGRPPGRRRPADLPPAPQDMTDDTEKVDGNGND
jgi:hypothetical protein